MFHDGGGSKSGQVRWAQMPEKSWIDGAPCLSLLAGPAAGTTVCPQVGVAAAAANITNKRKSRRLCTPASFSWFVEGIDCRWHPCCTLSPEDFGNALDAALSRTLHHYPIKAVAAVNSGIGLGSIASAQQFQNLLSQVRTRRPPPRHFRSMRSDLSCHCDHGHGCGQCRI
jgi:hypothetical protein